MRAGYDYDTGERVDSVRAVVGHSGGVGYELTLQDKLLEELHGEVSDLIEALTPALLPDSPALKDGGEPDQPPGSELSDRLRSNSDTVRRQVVRVRELRGRLHL